MVLKELPDNSIDSIVTDPPYGLSFMGRKWDYDVPSIEVWQECLRVLKPGGHLLAFAGTRTQHRMAVRIEDAGFEIRDMIAWVYGSGFPKSLDVSKAIDKARNSGRDEVLRVTAWIRAKRDELGLKTADLDAAAETAGMAGHWVSQESQPAIPTLEQWQKLEPLLGEPPEWMRSLLLPARKPGDAWEQREVIGRATDGCGNTDASMHKVDGFAASRSAEYDITAPATDAARKWSGWGTALKPALEPITMARKPLIGAVAENVLAHGTGALNIDGCRVGISAEDAAYITERIGGFNATKSIGGNGAYSGGDVMDRAEAYDASKGRWPANLIHDGSDEVVAAFPTTAPAKAAARGELSDIRGDNFNRAGGKRVVDSNSVRGHTDNGGSAARFFYCAKASKRDRDEGLEGFEVKQATGGGGGVGDYLSDVDSASGKFGSEKAPARNHHPTVKPTDLMRYLCRLVTPPSGVVLDPFMGSGSTGKGAVLEGFRFIGIEREAEYLDFAKARIEAAQEIKGKETASLFNNVPDHAQTL